MNRFFTILFAASCLTAVGQVTYPYNPDGNADGDIAVGDLQDFLGTYGNPFSPSEIMVGDSTLSVWIEYVNESILEEDIVEIKSWNGSYADTLSLSVGTDKMVIELPHVLDTIWDVYYYPDPTGPHVYEQIHVDSIAETLAHVYDLAWMKPHRPNMIIDLSGTESNEVKVVFDRVYTYYLHLSFLLSLAPQIDDQDWQYLDTGGFTVKVVDKAANLRLASLDACTRDFYFVSTGGELSYLVDSEPQIQGGPCTMSFEKLLSGEWVRTD